MSRPVRHAIAALLGGVTIAFAAAGWALWLKWGATGWPRLDAFAAGIEDGNELLVCLVLVLLGLVPLTLARSLLPPPGPQVQRRETAQPRRTWTRPLAELRVQLVLAVILLAAVLPYAFGAPELSWFLALIHRTPHWIPLALFSLLFALAGARCIRDALRAPAAPAVGA
ncbi:hypothetical protein P2H44_00470 [Albimonas sp. CAU 1670]|uniref:hypothetical protein n=1 Tax=Albimonas sp. CAU 1670 TaxID=3032599 RepID=UPI0023DB9FAE|nr:hypothetical protein [Albimonas sp. CAU 1670]MDF2231017.1 hypothetical protein [Albimonas sp. CAU 1670]